MRADDQPVAWVDGIPVLSAPAEIDITNAAQFGQTLSACLDLGHVRLVVDMSGTAFCDMAGMRQLMQAQERACAAGGEVRFVIRNATMLRVLEITGMDHLLPIFASLNAAIGAPPASASRPPVTSSNRTASAYHKPSRFCLPVHRQPWGMGA